MNSNILKFTLVFSGLIFLTMGCKMTDDSLQVNKVNLVETEDNMIADRPENKNVDNVELAENNENSSDESVLRETKEKEEMHVKAILPIKNPMEHNPVMTQSYSADPYAMYYDGRIYLYMTADKTMYEADGSIKKNNYSNINTIHVVSSDDLVNWTDHGEVAAAGRDGAANWGNNSWAPAACCKEIDGKMKFFLYFANSGNGIAVLTSDSPTGPFVDPLGQALVSRNTPTCAEVTWLFDPAVLIDDDGTGYLYFGGGIPSDEYIANPGTARVAKLGDDMISLAEDPVPIENVQYLFEDSGINKLGDKYVYSYCSNFNVPNEFKAESGFGNGEIIIMEGESPLGPFKTVRSVLKNPEDLFSYGGNNHHCMFEFNGKWYITYHASLIEEKLGANNGYRSVNVDEITIGEDGLFAPAKGTKAGVEQVKAFDPYVLTSFTTMANQAGISVVEDDAKDGLKLCINEDGAFTQIIGADFKDGASKCTVRIKAYAGGSLSVRTSLLNGDDAGKILFNPSDDYQTLEITFADKITGNCDIYFVFEGEGTLADTFVFE